MKTPLASLLLLPSLAIAAESCKVEKTQELALDLDGVKTLVVDLGLHSLRLDGAADGDGVVRGRACASSQSRLEELSLSQERDGDRLVFRAERPRSGSFIGLFASSYAYYDLKLRVPADLAIELRLGSGNAFVNRVASLDADVGSGDLEARDVAGAFAVAIGSGDVVAESVGTLRVPSVGSGDLTVREVRGDARIGSVGSGDATVSSVKGNVGIGSVGSGDLAVHEVQGKVDIGSIGSGDVALRDVAGSVELEHLGSGDLDVADVGGDVHLQHKGSGDVHSRNVKGEVSVVLKPRS